MYRAVLLQQRDEDVEMLDGRLQGSDDQTSVVMLTIEYLVRVEAWACD